MCNKALVLLLTVNKPLAGKENEPHLHGSKTGAAVVLVVEVVTTTSPVSGSAIGVAFGLSGTNHTFKFLNTDAVLESAQVLSPQENII